MDCKMAKVSVKNIWLCQNLYGEASIKGFISLKKYVIEDQKSFPEKVSIKAPLTTS